MYSFPWDARLWFAFWLRDVGYVDKPNMDGAEGETHVELGAKIMGLLFGKTWAAFAKLCRIRGNFKGFLSERGMGARSKGAASPLAPLSIM